MKNVRKMFRCLIGRHCYHRDYEPSGTRVRDISKIDGVKHTIHETKRQCCLCGKVDWRIDWSDC